MSSPSWLTPGVGDEEAGKSSSSATQEHNANWTSATTENEDFSSDAQYSAGASANKSNTDDSNKKRGCWFWSNLLLGTVFSILFIIAASLEWNDANLALMWGIFYILHAILAIVGTLRLCMCKALLTKPILFVSASMLIWSIVLLCLAAVDLSKTPKNTAGEDTNNNRTARQEIGFELGGAILGCLSCIYYIVMCMCCDKAPTKE